MEWVNESGGSEIDFFFFQLNGSGNCVEYSLFWWKEHTGSRGKTSLSDANMVHLGTESCGIWRTSLVKVWQTM